MKIVTGIARFFYGLLVGDSWPLTLTVVVLLGAGVAIANSGWLPSWLIATGLGLLVSVAAAITIIAEARAAHRRLPENR